MGRGTYLTDLNRRKERLNNEFMTGCWRKDDLNEMLKDMVHQQNQYRSAPSRAFVNDRTKDTGLASYTLMDSVMPPVVKQLMESFSDPMPEHFGCPECQKYYLQMKRYRDLVLLIIGVSLIVWGLSKWKDEE